jgi:hypothetical protein
LRGESGLHKLNEGSGEERRRHLARVSVHPVSRTEDVLFSVAPGGRRATQPRPAGDTDDAGDDGAVVRVYHLGRHRYVRDPLTGVRVNHVQAVLDEGQIDRFLLARIRMEAGTRAS